MRAFREVPEIGPRLGLRNFLIPKKSMMPVGRLVSPVMLCSACVPPKLEAPSLGVVTGANRTLSRAGGAPVCKSLSKCPLLLVPGIVAEETTSRNMFFRAQMGQVIRTCSRTGPCDGKVILPLCGEPESFNCAELVRFAL